MRSPRVIVTASVRVEVDHRHDHLAAVAGVDQARRVRQGEAVLRGQARARQHQPGVSVGDRDGEPGRHHRARPRRDLEVGVRAQVEPGVARVLGLGQRGARVEPAEGQLHQRAICSMNSSRLPNGSRTYQRSWPSRSVSVLDGHAGRLQARRATRARPEHPHGRVRLRRRAESFLDPQVQLERSRAEPAAAARRQVFGLRHPVEHEHLAVEALRPRARRREAWRAARGAGPRR